MGTGEGPEVVLIKKMRRGSCPPDYYTSSVSLMPEQNSSGMNIVRSLAYPSCPNPSLIGIGSFLPEIPLSKIFLRPLSLMRTSRFDHRPEYMTSPQVGSTFRQGLSTSIEAKPAQVPFELSDVGNCTDTIPLKTDGMTENRSDRNFKPRSGQLRVLDWKS